LRQPFLVESFFSRSSGRDRWLIRRHRDPVRVHQPAQLLDRPGKAQRLLVVQPAGRPHRHRLQQRRGRGLQHPDRINPIRLIDVRIRGQERHRTRNLSENKPTLVNMPQVYLNPSDIRRERRENIDQI
jgi:hypothetical protein